MDQYPIIVTYLISLSNTIAAALLQRNRIARCRELSPSTKIYGFPIQTKRRRSERELAA